MLKELLSHIRNDMEGDSIYNRRVARGEVPEDPERIFQERISRMERQRQENAELILENGKLRRELERVQKELEGMRYVHEMDELIDAMKDKKPEKAFNPFAAWNTGNGGGAGTTETRTEKVLSPDQFESPVPDDDSELAEIIEESEEAQPFGAIPIIWDCKQAIGNPAARYAAYWDGFSRLM